MNKRVSRYRLLPSVLAIGLLQGVSLMAFAANDTGNADTWPEEEAWGEDVWSENDQRSSIPVRGFLEALAGTRFENSAAHADDATAKELRARFEVEHYWSTVNAQLKADIVLDDVRHDEKLILQEAALSLPVGQHSDVKIGRQTLTWGTGDLLFLNDLFPKDWESFFAGREQSYLKAPSDALKWSVFTDTVNVDLVWSPNFNPDTTIEGRRFSYFTPLAGDIVGDPVLVSAQEPDNDLHNGEFAVRVYRRLGSWEVALYGYRGFFKQPLGFDSTVGQNTYPRLNAYGFSVRGNVLSGIGHMEASYYDSRDDKRGDQLLVPNSQIRTLMGYEQELITDVTVAGQYYLETTLDYRNLRKSSGYSPYDPDPYRHVLTARLTHSALRGNWINSLFVFWSPNDRDYFVLPSTTYRWSDQWQTEVGGRLFGGQREHTFFGSLEQNSNIFVRFRLNY